MSYCKKCGKELRPGLKFCTNCGARVPGKVVMAPEKPKVQPHVLRKIGWTKIAVTAIVAVVAVVIGLYISRRSGPGVQPANIVYSLPITLTNNQPVATPAPFQQMLVVDSAAYSSYEAPNLQNIKFFDSSGRVIQSWLESGNNSSSTNTIYWLNLADGIPASSSITVYMRFASPATNIFNAQTTGEAPWMSSAYAQYDSGQNVFQAYYNMKTNPLASALNGLGHYSIASGYGPLGNLQPLLTWTGTSSGNEFASIRTNQFPPSFSITAWVETNSFPWDIGLGSTISTALYNGYSVDPGAVNNTLFGVWKFRGNAWDIPIIESVPYRMSSTSWYTLQYDYVSGGHISGYVEPYQDTLNVQATASYVSTTDSSYSTFDSILLAPYSAISSYVTRWALIVARSYPPNGVMPSSSFGSIISM